MFQPSRDEVRQFFFDTWTKYRRGEPLEGLERIAIQVILLHPEYHGMLERPEEYELDGDAYGKAIAIRTWVDPGALLVRIPQEEEIDSDTDAGAAKQSADVPQ